MYCLFNGLLRNDKNFIASKLKFILLLMCLIKATNGENVVQLTADNFKQLTSQYEAIFINFYADWCRFSQILAPVFEETYTKIRKDFPGNQILFARVDCDVETALATRFHISKYPTLKLTVNGKMLKQEFRGQRSVAGMTEFIQRMLKDPEKILTPDSMNGIDNKKGAIIAYYSTAPDVSPEYKLFRKMAIELKNDCNFYWVTGAALSKNPFPQRFNIITHKPARSDVDEKNLIYDGGMMSYDELSTWATDKCIPLVREITFENAEELTEEGLPFLILFHHPDDSESVKLYTKIVSEQLLTESSSINFLTADGVKFAHPLHHLGKQSKDLPLIAIDSFRHMYLFNDFKDIQINGKLKQFIQDLHSGKLHREFHFGPDPTSTDNKNKVAITQPPESTFRKLAPSSSRYTLLRDEL